MKKFSTTTWQHAEDIYKKIIKHPFNVELANGSLCINKFAYYLEQDILYLHDYYRCLSLIAAKLPPELGVKFLKHANGCIEVENSLHQYLGESLNLKQFDKTKSLTTLAYTSFLLQICYSQPLEIALASILPCFWVYNEVGKSIIASAKNLENLENNPYKNWISTYSSLEFSEAVEEVIAIYDDFANRSSEDVKIKMLEVYRIATVLEYHFWDKAYNRNNLFDI